MSIMFKKLLKIVLTITSFMTICLWIIFVVSKYNDSVDQTEYNIEDNYTQINIPIHINNNHDYHKVISYFNDVSKELDIPFLKRAYYQGNERTQAGHINYQKTVNNVTFETNKISDSLLDKNFKMHLKNNHVYATEPVGDQVQIPKYGSLNFTIKTISAHTKPHTREGTFFIQTKNPKMIDIFQAKLSAQFNSGFNIKTNKNDFNSVIIPETLPNNSGEIFQVTITMTIFQIVLIIIYCLSLSYEIGVCRLLGYKVGAIIIYLILPYILLGSFLGFIVGLIGVLTTNQYDLLKLNIAVLCLVILISIGVVFLTVFALQKLPTNRMLIKINYSKVIFLLLYLFKGIIMTFILLSVLPVSELGYQYINNTSTKDLKVYSDYAVFFPTAIGYNQADLVNPENAILVNEDILYPKINSDGGLLIDTTAINSKILMPYKSVTINRNYLQFHHLFDSNGNMIKLSKNSMRNLVLIPDKYTSNQALMKQIRHYLSHDLKLTHPLIKAIRNNQQIIDESGNRIQNYSSIRVYNEKADNLNHLNIITGDNKDPLKIALHGKSPDYVYKTVYKHLLYKNNLLDNYSQLIRASDINNQLLKQSEGLVLSNAIFIGISLLLFVIISLATAYLYFSVYGRSYAIKQTLGISIFKSSIAFWKLWLGQLLITILFILGTGNKLDPATISLFLIAVIIDLIISIFGIKIFSHHAIRSFLND